MLPHLMQDTGGRTETAWAPVNGFSGVNTGDNWDIRGPVSGRDGQWWR